MKPLIALALATFAFGPALAQTSVGVSIGINQPGVYGRIDLGNVPPPPLVYPQPVIIQPTPVAVYQRPIYLYVPVVYQQNWGRYCGRYNACGQPVYFVQEQWVRDRYHREYRGRDRDRDRRGDDDRGRKDKHRDKGRGNGRDKD